MPVLRSLSDQELSQLDPYTFFAVVGKRVIHPGGRTATEKLLARAAFAPGQHVVDVGCGVGTTAIEVARRYGAVVTAVDVAPLMLERAALSVRRAGMSAAVTVEYGDICNLRYADGTFDRVVAEAVTMFVDRPRAAAELVRVCKPGGRVLATEFYWREPPSAEARRLFLGEVCPGLQFETVDDWLRLYTAAGLTDVHVETGPFDMMTPRGFLHDEGWRNAFEVMLHVLARPSSVRKMAWLMPRVARAVPYLGFILVHGTRPLVAGKV